MRYFIFLIIFGCIHKPVRSQEHQFKKIMPGFEFGMNNGQQQLRKSDQVADLRVGFRAGLSLEKPATRRLTFIGNLSYVQLGAGNVRFTTNDERLNYAEFSIKAVEYLPLFGSETFLSLGPYFSYGINGEVTNVNGATIISNPFKLSEYQRFEWGIGGNIGFKTPWGTYLQGGMQTAFNNFYEMQGSKYFNFSLMLTVGHTIGWKNFKSYRKTT